MKRAVVLMFVFAFGLCLAETGSGTSPEGELDIHKREEAPPKLSFTAKLADANGNGICEGEEQITLVVTVTNSGKGSAQGVRVVLSGGSGLVSRLGKENIIGTIEPDASASETLATVLPPSVEPEEDKSLVVKVKESRDEWSCPDVMSFTVAVQPRKGGSRHERTYVDVDLVPSRRHTDPNAVAVVIGIGDYREESVTDLPNAENDAKSMRAYLENVCGVEPRNVIPLYGDRATKGDLDELFNTKLPRKVKPGGTVYIYFAGHGTPSIEGHPNLVPYDGTAASEAKLYPVSQLVEQAKEWKSKRTLVMLDVCFAGENRALPPKGRAFVREDWSDVKSSDKCVVLTASGQNQTANDLVEAKHGLFTYYLLKALKSEGDKDGDGWVTLKELYDYVRDNVSNEAADRMMPEQDPTIVPQGVEQSAAGWKLGKSR